MAQHVEGSTRLDGFDALPTDEVLRNGNPVVYDFVGGGFGPAGIALATALEDAREEGRTSPWRTLFLEKAADSKWQAEMLLPGTDIQHHFLRDFATPRNPRSRFTFVNYLHEKGRLFPFCLLGGNPSRTEWSDYVQWVAQKVGDRTLYRHEVVAVEPLPGDGSSAIDLVGVRARDLASGTERVFVTRNLVLATGRKPNMPPLFAPFTGSTVFHSHFFKSKIEQVDGSARPTFAVIGSAQSAGEILLHLVEHFPQSTIYSIGRNAGFRQVDHGHFSNEVYFPEEADYVHSLSKENRRLLYEDVKQTNYACLDFDVSRALYLKRYEASVNGRACFHLIKRSEVSGFEQNPGGHCLVLKDIYRHTTQELQVQVVILCTGYFEERFPSVLEPVRHHLKVDAEGDPIVTRDYQIETTDNFLPGIFLSGLSERSHGISDSTSFSMMAIKAQRIFDRLETLRRQNGFPQGGHSKPQHKPGGVYNGTRIIGV
jgi:L-ornithine N5-monooxygenase